MSWHAAINSDRYNLNLQTVVIILEIDKNYEILTDKSCQQTNLYPYIGSITRASPLASETLRTQKSHQLLIVTSITSQPSERQFLSTGRQQQSVADRSPKGLFTLSEYPWNSKPLKKSLLIYGPIRNLSKVAFVSGHGIIFCLSLMTQEGLKRNQWPREAEHVLPL